MGALHHRQGPTSKSKQMSRAPFLETDVLEAVMDEDPHRAKEIIRELLPNELRGFILQLLEAAELAQTVERERE